MKELKTILVSSETARHLLLPALGTYLVTTIIVVAAVWFADKVMERRLYRDEPGVIKSMTNWDGRYYVEIVTQGYKYDPARETSIAFFPAYPLLGAALHTITGLSPPLALLVVSHACLLAAFILMGFYLKTRIPDAHPELLGFALLAMGLWPTSLFFRMAYSESLFLLVLMWAMFGMARDWMPFSIALIIGLATGCRPTGIALFAPFLFFIWERSRNLWTFVWQVAVLCPIGAWGILQFMLFQALEFGDPLAFTNVQNSWAGRAPVPWMDKAVGLFTLEPMCAVYDSTSLGSGGMRSPHSRCST